MMSPRLEAAWERRPDVCLITAPTSLHLALALKGAEQGCHLFIEKPLWRRWQGLKSCRVKFHSSGS